MLGAYITTLGGFGAQFGSFSYAPLTGNAFIGDQGTLTPAEQLIVWLGVVAVWAAGSIWLLQDDDRHDEPQHEGAHED